MLMRPGPHTRAAGPHGRANPPLAPGEAAYRLRQTVEQAQRDGLPEKLEWALNQRRQFWVDTCREALEMRAPSPQVLELHRRHGCRFCAPTPQQAQHVLDALDGALPGWECDHAELFYRTLELNFPELPRPCRTRRKV